MPSCTVTLLWLPIQQMILDSMHCTITIVKKLVSLLAWEAISQCKLTTEWELLLEGPKCKMHCQRHKGSMGNSVPCTSGGRRQAQCGLRLW